MKDLKFYLVGGLDNVVDTIISSRDRVNLGVVYSSISPGYSSEEELRIGENILNDCCSSCGGVVSDGYSNTPMILRLNMCHNCCFWTEKCDNFNDDDRAWVMGGVHYVVGKVFIESKHKGYNFRGHGGRRFTWVDKDGDDYESSNLWCQGIVPKLFRDRLPDNGKFN